MKAITGGLKCIRKRDNRKTNYESKDSFAYEVYLLAPTMNRTKVLWSKHTSQHVDSLFRVFLYA